jgi:hypothetical protein
MKHPAWMLKFLVVCLIALGGCAMNNESANKIAPTTKKEVVVATEEITRSLGGSVPVTISYFNRTNGDMSLREPAKTWEVKLLSGSLDEKSAEMPFGRIFYYKSGDLERRTIENAETIELEPGGVYEFEYDVGQRWPELFVPGVNVLQVKDVWDDDETVFSNEIEVNVIYDESTFPALLAIAGNEESTVDSCQFASHWISQIYNDFHLATGDITDDQKEENRDSIAAARIWWDAHGNDTETLELIESLNPESDSAR